MICTIKKKIADQKPSSPLSIIDLLKLFENYLNVRFSIFISRYDSSQFGSYISQRNEKSRKGRKRTRSTRNAFSLTLNFRDGQSRGERNNREPISRPFYLSIWTFSRSFLLFWKIKTFSLHSEPVNKFSNSLFLSLLYSICEFCRTELDR